MITKHSLDPQDAITMAKLRPMLASTKGSVTGPAARPSWGNRMNLRPVSCAAEMIAHPLSG